MWSESNEEDNMEKHERENNKSVCSGRGRDILFSSESLSSSIVSTNPIEVNKHKAARAAWSFPSNFLSVHLGGW